MSPEMIAPLGHYREMAIRILGLPTNRAISHKDVAMMYHAFADSLHDSVTGDALLLVQMLAHDFVDARSWVRPDVAEAVESQREEQPARA